MSTQAADTLTLRILKLARDNLGNARRALDRGDIELVEQALTRTWHMLEEYIRSLALESARELRAPGGHEPNDGEAVDDDYYPPHE